jgi:hypothetical protein
MYSAKAVERDWWQYVHERGQRELPWKLRLNQRRFERLWNKAHREGRKAMLACAEGPAWCFAHVRIPNCLFTSWLIATGKAEVSADFAGMQAAVRVFIHCRDVNDRDVNDCNRLDAYAEAFARVLIAAGIDAYDESRLD